MQTNFTYTPYHLMDGNSLEVAERACDQAISAAFLLDKAVIDAEKSARNMQMDRNLAETPDDARDREWETGVQAAKWAKIHAEIDNIQKSLRHLRMAATYDPR